MSFRNITVFDHVGDQRRALGNLLKTGEYSDFVIICGKARHRVHKAIICPRSDFFKAEAQTGEVELPEDERFAVSMMIEYLYHQTYTIPYDADFGPEYQKSPAVPYKPSTALLNRARPSLSGNSSISQSLLHPITLQATGAFIHHLEESAVCFFIVLYVNLRVHYKVYALGEKYGIPGLKALAAHNFETECEKEFGRSRIFDLGDLIHEMREAYACTAEGDRPLRDAVVRILKSKPIIFEREDVKEFLKEEGLAYDMVMSCVQDILRRGEDD
ncbi:kelch 4 [Fusarium subglutinans]|uniref:Kelch 4 n=1 Tax=Gibberella subglutinans TaxID=42677 RepID=A0A8H5QB36_GIBSU|nr:kelch 4 [Fusarium subglutinans]KAF5610718.1 kelch 4 [Fusarium subglutinans]